MPLGSWFAIVKVLDAAVSVPIVAERMKTLTKPSARETNVPADRISAALPKPVLRGAAGPAAGAAPISSASSGPGASGNWALLILCAAFAGPAALADVADDPEREERGDERDEDERPEGL